MQRVDRLRNRAELGIHTEHIYTRTDPITLPCSLARARLGVASPILVTMVTVFYIMKE